MTQRVFFEFATLTQFRHHLGNCISGHVWKHHPVQHVDRSQSIPSNVLNHYARSMTDFVVDWLCRIGH